MNKLVSGQTKQKLLDLQAGVTRNVILEQIMWGLPFLTIYQTIPCFSDLRKKPL